MIKTSYIRNSIFFLFLVYFAQGVLYAQGTIFSKVVFAIIILISVYYFFKTLLMSGEKSLFFKAWTVLLLLNIFGFIFTGTISNSVQMSMFRGVLLTLMIFYPFYFLSQRNMLKSKHLITFLLLMIPVIILRYFLVAEQILDQRISDKIDVVNNTSYFFLGLMPYVFLIKQRKIFAVSIMLVLIFFIIQSSKRGALFSGVIGLLYFAYFQMRTIEKKNRLKGYLYLTAGVFGISYFIFYLFSSNEYFILRMQSILEENSSGRDTIFMNLFKSWFESENLINLLFGYGFAASLKLSGTGNFAHNDWLELLSNYGLFGFVLNIIFFWAVLKEATFHQGNIEKRIILLAVLSIVFVNTIVYRFYSSGDGFLYSIMLAYLVGSKAKELDNRAKY